MAALSAVFARGGNGAPGSGSQVPAGARVRGRREQRRALRNQDTGAVARVMRSLATGAAAPPGEPGPQAPWWRSGDGSVPAAHMQARAGQPTDAGRHREVIPVTLLDAPQSMPAA